MAALALTLLWLGLRGRRLNDHPLCRRCRFDLVGIYPGRATCPECGADTSAKRAIRVGQRRRRPVVAAAGALCLLATLALGTLAGWGWATTFNWNTVKPAWWLEREAAIAGPAAADAALDELITRLMDDRLTAPRTASMITKALAVQGDPNARWITAWGDFIEGARVKGRVPDPEWIRYARHGVNVGLAIRSPLPQGEACPIQFQTRPSRVGENTKLAIRHSLAAARIDGALIDHGTIFGAGGSFSSLQATGSATSTALLKVDAPPGCHTLTLVWTLAIVEGFNGPTLVEYPLELSADLEIVPAGTPLVRLVPDESLHAVMERAIAIDRLFVQGGGGTHSSYDISFKLTNLPANIAMQMSWRAGDREWPVGKITVKAGYNGGHSTGGMTERFDADHVDVILRPSLDAAKATIDLTEIWDGEIVIPNVPVGRPRPASPPN